jgi:hypothetical protein
MGFKSHPMQKYYITEVTMSNVPTIRLYIQFIDRPLCVVLIVEDSDQLSVEMFLFPVVWVTSFFFNYYFQLFSKSVFFL